MSLGAIIPVKNEYGNIESMVIDSKRIKELSQIVFIDGGSTDGTFDLILQCISKYGDYRMVALNQVAPFNKFSAIKQARTLISTDHILIWDGDNTILVDDVQKMIDIYLIRSTAMDVFLAANRLTKQRQNNSFRLINFIGNYLFSILLVPILGRRIKDILSGVKIFPAYLLQVGCKSLLLIDKFGDVALFGIARKYKLNLLSIPCNYRKRGYGKSSIKRWSGGVVILRATIHLYFHRCFK